MNLRPYQIEALNHVLAHMFIPPTPGLLSDETLPCQQCGMQTPSRSDGCCAYCQTPHADAYRDNAGLLDEHPISGGEHDVVKDAIAEHLGITDFDGDKRGFWNEEGDVH